MTQSKPIPTRRNNPCVVCGDTKGRCREFSDHPDMILCMEVLDAPSTPPGFKFQGLSKDGTWGIIIRDTGEVDEAARKEWLQHWRQLRVERLKLERANRAQLLDEPTRDTHIRKILTQLGLSSPHRDNLKKRGLSDELIAKGMFRSVERWQRLDIEVSWKLAGVTLGGRSLMNFQTGFLCPVWNPEGKIIAWQLRVDDPADDNPKYLWASSRTKKRPNGPTAHLQNGELPLTFCSPVEDIDSTRILAQYIGLAEGILKPWIIAQLRNQITIGAAGGNFAGSPETLKRYLTAASLRLGGTQDLILWADAGAIANKNVMRQYRRTYELVTRWGYTLKVAWWGQLDKSCADPDEYAGEFEILTWTQFESLSRNPLRLWDDVTRSLDKIKRLLRPRRGFARRVRHGSSYNSGNQSNGLPRFIQRSTPEPISVYTPDDLPTLEEYKKLGCPKINYLGDERVSIWKEAVKKGWQHILDKSAPGLGKSHTAGSMTAEEFGSRQLWYLASDHRNPTTLTVETNFVDLPPRHSGFARDTTRLTPLGQPFLVHPNGQENFATTPGNCHRAGTFRALASKNINHIQESDNPICLSCHLYNACRNSIGRGFGYRKQRYSVLQYPQVRAHPDSLPFPGDYQFEDCGIFWDEASQIMRSRSKIEISISDFNQTAGELAVTAPELFTRLQPIFERLRFLFWGGKFGGRTNTHKSRNPSQNERAYCEDSQYYCENPARFENPYPKSSWQGNKPKGLRDLCGFFPREGSLWAASDIQLPTCGRYGYDDAAIRQLLGQPPDDIADIINQLTVKLAPDLRFLVESADSIDTSVGTKSERAASRQINKLLRSAAYQEVKQALEAVSLNWLIPLLEVWGRYIRGALHFDRGILSVHQQDTRHRDVANAAQYNIYLDGTLDVRYLALKLGVGVENILVVEQVTPQYENLKVVQITDMGVLGRDRRESMHQRLEVLREKIEKLSPGIAFIERKSYAKPGDGYHFRDSRGVNRFQDATAVASVGIPYPNIGELAAEYQVLTGKPVVFNLPQVLDSSCYNSLDSSNALLYEDEYDGEFSALTQLSTGSLVEEDITFEEFVDSCVQSEIIQESGRLRAHLRPDERLVYYFVGDYDLEFLSDILPGIKLEKKAAVEISPLSGTTKQRAIWLVSRFFSRIFAQNQKPTQQEISQLAKAEDRNITQGRISQIAKEFGGWLIFSRIITELLSSFTNTKLQANYQFNEEETWIRDVYLPLLVNAGEIQPIEAVREVFQLISAYGWHTFRQILESVVIDVKANLLEYLLSIIPPDIASIFIDVSYFFNEDSS